MTAHTFNARIISAGDGMDATAIEVSFDPREVFGRARVPVVVEVMGHSYRSTICNMGGGCFVPLAKLHRSAAGVQAGQRVPVTMTLDTQVRRITPPRDLALALSRAGLLATFGAMSFTHQKEHATAVEEAKREETRQRRIAACVAMVRAWDAKRAAKMAKRAGTEKGPLKKSVLKKAALKKVRPKKPVRKASPTSKAAASRRTEGARGAKVATARRTRVAAKRA